MAMRRLQGGGAEEVEVEVEVEVMPLSPRRFCWMKL